MKVKLFPCKPQAVGPQPRTAGKCLWRKGFCRTGSYSDKNQRLDLPQRSVCSTAHQQNRPSPPGLSEDHVLLSIYHLQCITPWRLRMGWVYYMLSTALFKDRYSLPRGCWIKHEECAAEWVLRVCVCVYDSWRVAGWKSIDCGSGKWEGGWGDLTTLLLEILYNTWFINAFDLTHILTAPLSAWKLLSWFICSSLFSTVELNLFTSSKLAQKRIKSVLIAGGEGNAILARYRDVPDSENTFCNAQQHLVPQHDSICWTSSFLKLFTLD